MNIVSVADFISMVAFAIATVVILTMPTSPEGPVRRVSKQLFASALALEVFIGVSNVLEHGGITAALDVYEDFAEILFVPLVAYAAYSMYMTRQIEEQRLAANAAKQQHEMLMSIVDTSPAGIMVVDDAGCVVFANESAKRVLELEEEAGTGAYRTPGWKVRDPKGAGPASTSFEQFARGNTFDGVERVVEWPSGHKVILSMSATPMHDRSGNVGGSVVAFEDISSRKFNR
jgi:PAS domain S-box-containing protein